MQKKQIIMLILFLGIMAGIPRGADAGGDIQMTVLPNEILMGATYDGQRIRVSGHLPSDATAIIRVTGDMEDSKLKKKGRALGVLWMNQGTVEISHVPSVFLLYLPGEVKADPFPLPELGMEGIHRGARIQSREGDHDTLFEEFVKLKEEAGLYGVFPGAVTYGKTTGGDKSFRCTLNMPSDLPRETYQVEVVAVRNGGVVARARQPIIAREIGMPAFISSLALKHSTIYGVLAVLVAAIAGLVTGVIFKGGKGAH